MVWYNVNEEMFPSWLKIFIALILMVSPYSQILSILNYLFPYLLGINISVIVCLVLLSPSLHRSNVELCLIALSTSVFIKEHLYCRYV